MKTILITGAGGYLGQETAKVFLESGHDVIGTGTGLERPETLPTEVRYETADIRDQGRLIEIFKSKSIDVVCHLAGQKKTSLCESDPESCFSINSGGTAALLEAMKEANVPHLIYASTWLVYDLLANDTSNLSEKSLVKPTTVYGQSKLMGEEMVRQYYDTGVLKQYHIMRYGNIVGLNSASDAGGNFLEFAINAVKSQKEVEIFGDDYNTEDGTTARDFVDVKDAALANLAALSHEGSGTYNIGAGQAVSLKQITKVVAKYYGKEVEVKISPRRGEEPGLIRLDISAAQEDLGWKPKQSLGDTIGRFFTGSKH